MINISDFANKISYLKVEFNNLLKKLTHWSWAQKESETKGKSKDEKFSSKDKVTKKSITSKGPNNDGSGLPQKLVWENEEASMPDKSYAFDETTTDEDYDADEDFSYEIENEFEENGDEEYREDRYS